MTRARPSSPGRKGDPRPRTPPPPPADPCEPTKADRASAARYYSQPLETSLRRGMPPAAWWCFEHQQSQYGYYWVTFPTKRGWMVVIANDLYRVWFKSQAVARAHLDAAMWPRVRAHDPDSGLWLAVGHRPGDGFTMCYEPLGPWIPSPLRLHLERTGSLRGFQPTPDEASANLKGESA